MVEVMITMRDGEGKLRGPPIINLELKKTPMSTHAYIETSVSN